MREAKNSRALGREGEDQAAGYLERQGMKILERNFMCRQGEIDLIGYHKNCLVFVEVKYRRGQMSGTPESAVTPVKIKKLCIVADYYRYLHRYGDDSPFRYDVVAISGGEIRWYENAFEHMARGG